MTIKTTQKLINIGTSKGVTLPAKELKKLGVKPGDEVEVSVRKKTQNASDENVQKTANSLLERYAQDFKNLSQRWVISN